MIRDSHFFQDPWWNPAVEEQAVMRIHRIGQTKSVSIKRFIVKVFPSVELRYFPSLNPYHCTENFLSLLLIVTYQPMNLV